MPSSTRDRIVDVAMQLFGEYGYRGTSVAQIEAGAGLTPGAGGLYHHFRSKEAVLEAGIERHLARLDALRDIRRAFLDLGDLRAELIVTARYVLAELDSEAELLRILMQGRPQRVADAVDQLVRGTYGEFAAWLAERGSLAESRAAAIASVGLGSLISARVLGIVLGGAPLEVSDDEYVATWVEMMMGLLTG